MGTDRGDLSKDFHFPDPFRGVMGMVALVVFTSKIERKGVFRLGFNPYLSGLALQVQHIIILRN